MVDEQTSATGKEQPTAIPGIPLDEAQLRQLTDLVYRLMRDELLIARERRGLAGRGNWR
jgi:hypothetical protein